jgi:hypothetical protein
MVYSQNRDFRGSQLTPELGNWGVLCHVCFLLSGAVLNEHGGRWYECDIKDVTA